MAVTRDQFGNDVVTQARATATNSDQKEQVSVNLDLRGVNEGAFFLSTTNEQDQASYYYPLQIE